MAYVPVILTDPSYTDTVRLKMGLTLTELPDTSIQDPILLPLAESLVINRVGGMAAASGILNDPVNSVYIVAAAASSLCAQLCTGMDTSLKRRVQTIDTMWQKQNVDWVQKQSQFMKEIDTFLEQIPLIQPEVPNISLFQIVSNVQRNIFGDTVPDYNDYEGILLSTESGEIII